MSEATRVLKTYGFLVVIDGTVPDDHVEAAAWMNNLERLRDAAHVNFATPQTWRNWCTQRGLTVTRAQMEPARMGDLQQYLAATNTSAAPFQPHYTDAPAAQQARLPARPRYRAVEWRV